MYTALTIAGSDSSGGAGIQADIKTMIANGVFAMTAITALTAQNTTGVTDIMEVTPEFLAKQMDAVFTDIRPDAVKTGMISSQPLMRMAAQKLKEYDAKNIVVDPVMVATSGSSLMENSALSCMKECLLPLATIITPNIPETEALTGKIIKSEKDMEEAARIIYENYGCQVLVKGGHSINDANDYFFGANASRWFRGQRINNPNTHGTGCTLSSAIASGLAKGFPLIKAIEEAKLYLTGAIADGLDLGKGSGPLNHGFAIK